MSRRALSLFENGDLLFPVKRDGNRLPQKAVATLFFGRFALAHHRVEPVETHVPEVGFHGGRKLQVFLFVELFLVRIVAHRHDIALPDVKARDLRAVVIALQEFARHGHGLFFHRHHDPVDKGRGFAAVGQIPGFPVFFRPLAGIKEPVVIGVALKNMLTVLARDGKHVGARADRPGRKGNIVSRKARIGVESFGFPGHRREKRHRKPVVKLRVFAADGDFKGVIVRGPHAFAVKGREVKPLSRLSFGLLLFQSRGDVGGKLVKADNVASENPEGRAYHRRRRDALDAVDVVVSGEFARAPLGEVQGTHKLFGPLGRERQSQGPAVLILGKSRVRRKKSALSDRDRVDRVGDLASLCVGRQDISVFVAVLRAHERLSPERHERVGAL